MTQLRKIILAISAKHSSQKLKAELVNSEKIIADFRGKCPHGLTVEAVNYHTHMVFRFCLICFVEEARDISKSESASPFKILVKVPIKCGLNFKQYKKIKSASRQKTLIETLKYVQSYLRVF